MEHIQPWDLILGPDFGPLSLLDRGMQAIQSSQPNALPVLRSTTGITVASDYSESTSYETLSFLFTRNDLLGESASARYEIRKQLSSRNRNEMSYKKLNDSFRHSLLTPFLRAANGIHGISITVAIHKKVESLFKFPGKLKADEFGSQFSHWKNDSLEKALRITNLVGFFTAGFCEPKQDVLWITDEDPIVASETHLKQTRFLCKTALAQYSNGAAWDLICKTTSRDDGSMVYEDLAAIPDLVAGAVSDAFTKYYELDNFPGLGSELVPLPESLKQKSSEIIDWYSDDSYPLKRIVCLVPPRAKPWRIHLVDFRPIAQ